MQYAHIDRHLLVQYVHTDRGMISGQINIGYNYVPTSPETQIWFSRPDSNAVRIRSESLQIMFLDFAEGLLVPPSSPDLVSTRSLFSFSVFLPLLKICCRCACSIGDAEARSKAAVSSAHVRLDQISLIVLLLT